MNGRKVFEQSNSHALWDAGFNHEFMVDELRCRIRISFPGGKPSYELWVDGKLQSDGRYHASSEMPTQGNSPRSEADSDR